MNIPKGVGLGMEFDKNFFDAQVSIFNVTEAKRTKTLLINYPLTKRLRARGAFLLARGRCSPLIIGSWKGPNMHEAAMHFAAPAHKQIKEENRRFFPTSRA
jgi:hypothetical protein